MRTPKGRFAAAFAAVLLLAGCTNVATFDYSGTPGTLVTLREPGYATKSVAVMPFLDQRAVNRTPENPSGVRGSFYLGLLPIVPFGRIGKTEPETSDDFVSLGRFHFDARQDLATAAILSLKASGLFSTVKRANTLNQGDVDYIWRGRVLATNYDGKMFSYCITYFLSPGLWIVGAPSGVSTNELQLNFELLECSTGNVVWSRKYRGSDYIVHWIYARVGEDVSLYPQLMKQAMNEALIDLNNKLTL